MATLNIGMIVKNEEKRLRATLEALQPLRNAVDCRLIIADTGSNDGTVAIAQEFADIFLQITWENDFAKARNATLAEAKGDWFFYLDADEVLTEPEELIQFLNNTKLQKNIAVLHWKYIIWFPKSVTFGKIFLVHGSFVLNRTHTLKGQSMSFTRVNYLFMN